MAKLPGYVHRYTRILEALRILADHEDGLPLSQLADELGVEPNKLREELLAYYTAEPAAGIGIGQRLPGIDWLTAGGEEEDPNTAEIVVLTDLQAFDGMGAVRYSPAELAAVWRTGRLLAQYEPENTVLATALDRLAKEWLDGASPEADPGSEHLQDLRKAIAKRQQVQITYSRQWRPGVVTRVVDPYRLTSTARGWELDAGPLDSDGAPRIYLLSNIRELQRRKTTFEVPDGIDDVISDHRSVAEVTVVLPQQTAWSAQRLADRVDRVRGDDDMVTMKLYLSPPVVRRLAMVLAPAMGDGWIDGPGRDERTEQVHSLARRLLAHHDLELPWSDEH